MRTELQTERLHLRPCEAKDAPRLARMLANEKIVRMLAHVPWPYDERDALDFIADATIRWRQGEGYHFGIFLPREGQVGMVGLRMGENGLYDLGYWIGEDWWGRGFATEAAGAVVDWAAQDLGVTELESRFFEDNPASTRVLCNLGFTPNGRIRYVENPLRSEKAVCLGMRWRAKTAKRAINQ